MTEVSETLHSRAQLAPLLPVPEEDSSHAKVIISINDTPKSDSIEENPSTPVVDAPPQSRSMKAVWVASWFFLNVGLALLMKFVFSKSHFKFPVLLSTVHMFINTIFSFATMYSGLVRNDKQLTPEGNKRIRYFVFLFCLNIAFGNIAVKIVNLPLSQMVRSTIPIFIMITSTIMLGTWHSLKLVLTVVPIVAGVAMTAYGDVELTVVSLLLLTIGNIFAAMKVVVTNMYLVNDKLHPMVMLSKLSPLATLVMFGFAFMNGEVTNFAQVWRDVDMATYAWVVVSGIISFALNWTNFLANKSTSPLTMSVLGNLKQIVLVFLSVVYFGTHVALLSMVGIGIATMGLTFYSFLKYKEKK